MYIVRDKDNTLIAKLTEKAVIAVISGDVKAKTKDFISEGIVTGWELTVDCNLTVPGGCLIFLWEGCFIYKSKKL